MGEDRRSQETVDPVFLEAPEQPNGPDVSGTSFPLLSTVLAGFAVSIVVQIMLLPGADNSSIRVSIALITLLLSMLMFLSAIGFAVTAQANNYLPFIDLGSSGRHVLHVTDRNAWIRQMVQRWAVFHTAATASFYLGILLLLAGVNLIVWEFAGTFIALVLFVAILLNLSVVMYVNARVDELGAGAPDLAPPVSVEHRGEESERPNE